MGSIIAGSIITACIAVTYGSFLIWGLLRF